MMLGGHGRYLQRRRFLEASKQTFTVATHVSVRVQVEVVTERKEHVTGGGADGHQPRHILFSVTNTIGITDIQIVGEPLP